MGVVVRRYIDILTIIINFPYSTCISSFFGSEYINLSLCLYILCSEITYCISYIHVHIAVYVYNYYVMLCLSSTPILDTMMRGVHVAQKIHEQYWIPCLL